MSYKLFPPGSRRRRNGSYNTTFVARGTVGGHRYEVVTNAQDREGAAQFIEEWLVQYRRATERPAVVTFRYAATAYRLKREPIDTIDAANIERLIGYFADRALDTIVGADLITAAHELLPGQSNGSKNRHVITIASAILHYGARQGWCADARHQYLKVSKKSSRQPASDATILLLLKNSDLSGSYKKQKNAYLKGPRQDRNGPYKRLLLLLLYETGGRISDTLRLTDEHLDLPRSMMLVGSRKTDDGSWQEISPELLAALASLPRCGAEKFLLPWRTKWGVYKWLRPLTRKLGVSYTPHDSRHAMATDLYKDGRSEKQIADRGAWRDVRSVGRYIHHVASDVGSRTVGKLLSGCTSGVRGKKKP